MECLQHVGPDFEIGLELADEWHVDRMTERLGNDALRPAVEMEIAA